MLLVAKNVELLEKFHFSGEGFNQLNLGDSPVFCSSVVRRSVRRAVWVFFK